MKTQKWLVLFLTFAIMVSSFSLVASATQTGTIKESTLWFSEDGERVADENLIYHLENGHPAVCRGAVCCDAMHKVTYISEEHTYSYPLPSTCIYDKFRIVYCTNCETVWSRTFIGQYTHTHTKD